MKHIKRPPCLKDAKDHTPRSTYAEVLSERSIVLAVCGSKVISETLKLEADEIHLATVALRQKLKSAVDDSFNRGKAFVTLKI